MPNNFIVNILLKSVLTTDRGSVETGQFVCDQLRDYVASGMAIMVSIDTEIRAGYTLIGKSPQAKRMDEKISWIYQIAGLCRSLKSTIVVEHDQEGSEIAEYLRKFDGRTSVLSPLIVGNTPIGLVLLIDVPDSVLIPEFTDGLDVLSGVLAIKLQNLELIRKQDFEIRKRTDALQESEAYNRFLFDHVVNGLALSTMDGRLLDVNPAFAKISGRTIEETLQLSFWDITPEKSLDEQEVHELLLANDGRYGPNQMQFIHKNERLVPVVLKGARVELNGETLILSTVEDITEITKVQDEVLESSRRFMDVLKNVNLITIILDEQGKTTFCNDYFLSLTGYEAEEVIGNDWFSKFLPEEISTFVEERYKTAIRENKEFDVHYENLILTKQGERRLISWTNNFLRDANGMISGSASLGEDITERKKVENELSKSEARLRAIVEFSSDLIWETNSDGLYSYVSPQIETILGYRAEEVLNFSPINYVADNEKTALKILSDSISADQIPFQDIRNNFVHKTGKLIVLESRGVPLFDVDGQCSGYRGISRVIH